MSYQGVMVSSTFLDLEEHRKILMSALRKNELFAIGMEEYVAVPNDDVISSSLNMVRKGSAYIALISHRYGQIPICDLRNPSEYSVTRLEFEEAQKLKLPTLVFVMGDEHPVKKNEIETDPIKIKKLEEFKNISKAGRIYIPFNNLEEFTTQSFLAASTLKKILDEAASTQNISNSKSTQLTSDPIPKPPTLYAEPPYIGSHKFKGRQAELDILNDWASPADERPILLFEAIGGTGKSILTWEWTIRFSPQLRNDWAGIFWYSFYEKGATMADFCRRALAYMTQEPRTKFKDQNTFEMTQMLIHQLKAKPWLFILDGIERILVSYHRFDAAQLRDEEAGVLDNIATRDPCSSINPEDDDLLRVLAGSSPSKLLLTTRLIPRALLNNSHQNIPGVLKVNLPGLRPPDAESLIRSCGISGTSLKIQKYLKDHCDCHPLIVGVLAGLVNDYMPSRGNFDAWSEDPDGGGRLDLSNLNLVQKRNHILQTAFDTLPESSRQLLSTLALLSGSVDYPTITALNPNLPYFPEVPIPEKLPQGSLWELLDEKQKEIKKQAYKLALARRKQYEEQKARRSDEIKKATPSLDLIVLDLEKRGLLQYDHITKHHDLHPVVRAISAGGLKNEEKNRYGQLVVDLFSSKATDPFDSANNLGDFDLAKHIVNVLMQMGKVSEAYKFISKSSSMLLILNSRFEAHNEILTIISPFFSEGWSVLPPKLLIKEGITLAKKASIALRRINAYQESFEVAKAALASIEIKEERKLASHILNMASTVGELNQLELENRLINYAGEIINCLNSTNDNNSLLIASYRQQTKIGNWGKADSIWKKMNYQELPIDTKAIAIHHNTVNLFLRGLLTIEKLEAAEQLNPPSTSALGHRNLTALKGFWYLENNNFLSARNYLQEAITLAHKANKTDKRSEIYLAIAKFHLKELNDKEHAIQHLTHELPGFCYLPISKLLLLLGDIEQSKKFAWKAYQWAEADGTPYVNFKELQSVKLLFEELNLKIPDQTIYVPGNIAQSDWEISLIAKINAIKLNYINKTIS